MPKASPLREKVAALVSAATSTAAGPPGTFEDELVKYLQDDTMTDLVYLCVLERAATDRSSNAEVLNRCVRFLRTHLTQFEPSGEMLSQLSQFCATVIEGCTNDSVVKSAHILQSFVTKRITSGAREHSRTSSGEADTGPGGAGSTSPGASTAPIIVQPESVLPPPGESSGSIATRRDIVRNFIRARTRSLALPPFKGSLPWTLNFLDMFSGHFEKRSASSGRFEIVHEDDIIRMTDYAQTVQRIEAVSKAKKSEESRVYKESGQMPKPVKAPQLFAYKFYDDQPPIDLPTDKLTIITNSVITPNAQQIDERITASKIMIKILVDQYCAGDLSAIHELLALFFEMLEAPSIESKIHAFNLLFNLAIHTNLISENIPRFDPVDSSPENVPGVVTSRPKLDRNLAQIESILADLFEKLCEMLLFLVHHRVTDRSVWMNAFNCFLFFVSGDGIIDTDKVQMVDPRVFLAFLQHANLSDRVHTHVVAMMLNVLYENEDAALDYEALDEIGGIDMIISLFETSRSADETENLFVILFDYAIGKLSGSNVVVSTDGTDFGIVLQVLQRLGAPHMFRLWFSYSPQQASESIVRFITTEAVKRDPALGPIIETINKNLLVAIMNEFEKLIQAHMRLESELQPLVDSVGASNELSKAAQQAIKGLVSSDSEYERRQGVQWMFILCVTYKVDELSKASESPIGKAVEMLLNNMVSQKSERRSYLQICDKILLYRINKLGAGWSENEFISTMNFLNDKLNRLVTVQEKDENNLLAMFDLLMRAVLIDFACDRGPNCADLNYDRFLQGGAGVSYKVLKHINISLCHHLFAYLSHDTARDHHRNIRAVLLIFMIEQCRSKIRLDSIGGMAFFKALLSSRDSQLAYHASRFLVDQIKSEKPEQFRALLAGILAKAQQANDERIIDNPYLQIRSILELKKL